jgi:hypothetical protein
MMKTFIIHTEEEADKLVEEMEREGYTLAAMSNAGLVTGWRFTFLPKEAFEKQETEDE